MSATNPLPLIKEVENWKRNDIIDFLKDDKDPFNLDLDADDIEIIQKRKISGTDFLDLTAEKLGKYQGQQVESENLLKESKAKVILNYNYFPVDVVYKVE